MKPLLLVPHLPGSNNKIAESPTMVLETIHQYLNDGDAHSDWVNCVRFIPKSTVVSASWDKTVKVGNLTEADATTGGNTIKKKSGNGVEVSRSPIEKAILHWGFQLGMDFEAARSESSIIHVFPFNSDKKRGGVALQTITPSLQPDAEIHIHWKGAAEIILACCTRYFDTNDQLVDLDEEKMTVLRNVIEDMAADSLRCVAIAHRLLDKTENIPTGKEERACWSLPEDEFVLLAIVGLKVKMVTGDNVKIAKAIAVECGTLDSLVVQLQFCYDNMGLFHLFKDISDVNLETLSNLSLEERVANFIQNGDLDAVEE